MKIIDTTVGQEYPVKMGDVLKLVRKEYTDMTSYVMLTQIEKETYTLIDLDDGNRYYDPISYNECEKLAELRPQGEGLYPSELLEIFSEKEYEVMNVRATLTIE